MYPTLSVGPLALPTGPLLTIAAAVLGLEIMGRYGRRFQLYPDLLWNGGLIAALVGLAVARLWNVYRFWYVYQAEPLLIVSPRPGGFALWPGIIAAVLAAYVYMIYHRLDPLPVSAAAAVGLNAAGMVRSLADYLTGAAVGAPSTLPWAQFYFGAWVHPVGIYRLLGLGLLLLILWNISAWRKSAMSPVQVLLFSLFGYSLVRLMADGFLAEPLLLGQVRATQALALVGCLSAALLLARLHHSARSTK
ncbi:MAG: prolipoprotein diacylglyceryl transferase [Caldilineaceae bacterium]|nr:prolipoprotein diacylglyceryl transferase [Caldilineaceae bacterium]